MDDITSVLFGEFPRAVATDTVTGQLRQWVIHSEGEMALFLKTVGGERNPYASISWRPVGGNLKLDKVPFDFDTPQKPDWPVFGGDGPLPEDEMIARMRNDPEIADAVLDPVIEDARTLIERAAEDNTPAIAVFSGFGIHVYLLFKEKVYPDKQVDTTARMYAGNLNLDTVDPALHGDVKRVLRVPNAERVHIETDGRKMIVQRPTGVNTIPLVRADFDGLTATELLDMARQKRHPDPPIQPRPEMRTYDGYIRDVDEATKEDQRKVDRSVLEGNNDLLAFCLTEWLQMPCMFERIQQPEPPHPVRQNCAVLLFNLGFTPTEVTELFSRIGWRDWKRAKTKGYLQQIYRKGYSDMNCASIRHKGLCSPEYADDARECPCFGWSGGRAEWK